MTTRADRTSGSRHTIEVQGDRRSTPLDLVTITSDLVAITSELMVITGPDAEPSDSAMTVSRSVHASVEPVVAIRSLQVTITSQHVVIRGPQAVIPQPVGSRTGSPMVIRSFQTTIWSRQIVFRGDVIDDRDSVLCISDSDPRRSRPDRNPRRPHTSIRSSQMRPRRSHKDQSRATTKRLGSLMVLLRVDGEPGCVRTRICNAIRSSCRPRTSSCSAKLEGRRGCNECAAFTKLMIPVTWFTTSIRSFNDCKQEARDPRDRLSAHDHALPDRGP